MPTAPEDYPLWATDPPNPDDVSEPSTERKEDGFMSTDYPVPYRWINWLYTTIYAWIVYFNEGIPGLPRYDTLEEAVADLETDQIGFVNESESGAPLTVLDSRAESLTGDAYVASNGRYLFVGQTRLVGAYERFDVNEAVRGYLLSSSADSVTKIKISQNILYVSYGAKISAFSVSATTRYWTETCADTIIDFDVFDGKLFVALDDQTVAYYTVDSTSATLVLTNAIDEVVIGVCTDGVRVYILHDYISGSYGTVTAIDDDTALYFIDGDVDPQPMDGTTKARNIITCDSTAVYIALYATDPESGDDLFQVKCIDFLGVEIWSLALDYAPTAMTIDENWLYLATLTSDADNHAIYRVDKKTGAVNFYRDTAGSTDDSEVNPITSLATDGAKLFAGLGGATGTEKDWLKMNLGNEAPLLVQKRDETTYHTTLDFLAKVR